eukprot:COSAG02_NODE_3440_length_6739_cov_10.354819_6_plen_132_part_00
MLQGDKPERGRGSNYTSSLEGQPPDPSYGLHTAHSVGPNIAIKGLKMTLPGGGDAADVSIVPPHISGSYPPRYLGVRPAYGFFMRRAEGVTLSDVSIMYNSAEPEVRPGPFLSPLRLFALHTSVFPPSHHL